MKNDDTFNKIESWLSGELPEAEARAFEAEMAADAALASEVERHRRGREALNRLAQQALQTDMVQWRESLNDLPEPPADAPPIAGISNRFRWILGGLLLMLLGGIVYWFWPSENIRPDNPPVQEKTLPKTKTEIPVVIKPSDEPANEIKNPKQTEDKRLPQLIALAETNLSDFQGSIRQQYGQTMGDDEEENPVFTAGVKAFKQDDLKTAKKDLLLVLKADPFFPSAREILAFIYFREKNYTKAVQCYESFASQSADPAKDWRLLQFYLADYQNSRADFWKKLEEMTQPTYQPLEYQTAAINLMLNLNKLGFK